MKMRLSRSLLLATLLLTTCSSALVLPKIDRHPPARDWHRGEITSLSTYDPDVATPWQVDLRAYDLSALDLRDSLDDLLYADFDDQTIWPPDERMPEDFDRQHIMELGKNPGLGIRELHTQGVTGRGVGVAIIDQPLLTQHEEYADRLRLYEEINVEPGTAAQMHGAGVASIAVGRTVGVAPEADLYYIGSWTGDFGAGPEEFTYNFIYYAQAIRRVLEINRQLPKGQKIRVIAMQVGWTADQAGYDEITTAVQEAKAAGMLVVCSSLSDETIHGFEFNGLGRQPLADPDRFELYEPGLFWAQHFPDERFEGQLLVPMDSRTTASPLGVDEYVFYRSGGWSWAIPYIAGVYALVVQAAPDITPEQFWSLALETGRIIEVQHGDGVAPLGPIIDPLTLIAVLRSK